jgi:hypothetical protein
VNRYSLIRSGGRRGSVVVGRDVPTVLVGARRPLARRLPGVKGCESTLDGVLMFCVSEGAGPQGKSPRTHPMRGWRNRQTRWIQVPVPARAWGFNSPLAHSEKPTKRVSPGDGSHRRGPFLVSMIAVRHHTAWSGHTTGPDA